MMGIRLWCVTQFRLLDCIHDTYYRYFDQVSCFSSCVYWSIDLGRLWEVLLFRLLCLFFATRSTNLMCRFVPQSLEAVMQDFVVLFVHAVILLRFLIGCLYFSCLHAYAISESVVLLSRYCWILMSIAHDFQLHCIFRVHDLWEREILLHLLWMKHAIHCQYFPIHYPSCILENWNCPRSNCLYHIFPIHCWFGYLSHTPIVFFGNICSHSLIPSLWMCVDCANSSGWRPISFNKCNRNIFCWRQL